ncbi:DUF885 domain-containing protein [Janibacter indicus]|uniref:Uncharacterized conserved protein, DUF885 familyt n=1 Tax=Janibacter indicus TaxID=857417 RepID=A0A1W1ZS76_9MICO|nr:DUF885 domain-containing protein [Janibacter indicus]SMC51247.1 Uncharacterized conserved protein, DUF885 familyt [Janibacter indicus]
MTQDQRRPQTDVDRIAEAHLDREVALSPITATYLGLPGHDGELDDLSPEGFAAHSRLRRETLAALDRATPVDDVDRVTVEAMRERLGLAEEFHDAGLDLAELNVIASPLQAVRDVFDLMPTASADDWATLATRMGRVPDALDQWTASLTAAATKGEIAPLRQYERCIEQCADLTAPDGYFAGLLTDARTDDGPLPDSVAADLRRSVEAAASAYRDLASRLAPLRDRAPEADACGRERYALHSRAFLGARIDLEETYAWGQEELARITAEMTAVAERIQPGASVKEAVAALDADPRYQLHGTDALREWMQRTADEAIELLSPHLDIPEPVRTIECRIAPTETGGIYYTGPSDDFSRPGRMWWSVPKGVTDFGTWRELTTVYHEGVPGHHLQIGQTVHRKELLNRWRRLASWTSGHGEGWALYAEWLMAELGHMDDPGNRMGLLDGQSLRAARVVLDIGVHCGFEAPAEVGGGAWTYDKAWDFLSAHANMDEGFLRFELDRYLGWPGQAPSYKIGERLWLQLREETARREGAAFDLRAFHRRALDVGGVGLDTLRSAVLG